MTSANVATVLRAYASVNAGDLDAVTASWADDAVLDYSESRGPEQGVYRTAEERMQLWERLSEAWSEVRWDAHEVAELPGGRVMVVNRVTLRGKGSGVEVNATGTQLWTLRDGVVTAFKLYQDREGALESVGKQLRAALADAHVYFVCEARPHGEEPRPLLDAALRGGVDLIQLRESELSDAELVRAARPFREAADEHGALFILNDRPDLVAACEADGVHVGQGDMAVAAAREAAGPGALVGLSTHSEEQVTAAYTAQGDARPDQISVGPVWETPTKEGRPGTGLGLIEFAAANATLPWFAIGGIDTANVAEVVAAGGGRIVVVRAIRDAEDPQAAARELREAVEAGARVGS
jgi:thiamine-phosphate pyrophosphorylase